MEWEKLEEVPYKAGYRRLLNKTFRLPDGTVHAYDIKDEGKAVCMLAMTEEDEVILVECYRPGPEILLKELPGGAIDAGEEPQVAAARELLEETGYAGELHFVGTSRDDAYSNLLRYNFVARHCKKVAEPDGDADEFGRVILMSMEAFRAHLRTGELTDVETGYLCLDYLQRL